MTKYVLVGGYPSQGTGHGQDLCLELVSGFFTRPIKILDCVFAVSPTDQANVYDRDQRFFARHLHPGSFVMQRAVETEFLAQTDWADVVWIKGGETDPLMKILQRFPKWAEHLDGKTVGGTSAGAYALATHYHELDRMRVGDGLGLVPVSVAAHWRSPVYADLNWDEVKHQLEMVNPKLPLALLKEGEFLVC